MKLKTVPPLSGDLLRHEKVRHAERVREIRALAPLLQRLAVFVPALEERDLWLYPQHISLDRSRKGRPAVRLSLPLADHGNLQLHAALLGLGFVTELQVGHGSWSTVHMRHGTLRLVLSVSIPAPAVPALRSTAGAATA